MRETNSTPPAKPARAWRAKASARGGIRGATVISYALLLSLISAFALGTINLVGSEVAAVLGVPVEAVDGGGGAGESRPGLRLITDAGAWRWYLDIEGGATSPDAAVYAADCQAYRSGLPEGVGGADLGTVEEGVADGLYWVSLGGDTPIQAHCDMTEAGEGWTLAARLGSDDSLGFEAAAWTNPAPPSSETPRPTGSGSALYDGFYRHQSDTLRACIADACVETEAGDQPIAALFAGGSADTTVERGAMLGLMASEDQSDLPYCDGWSDASGFNRDLFPAAARFGALLDDNPACRSAEGAIGFGLRGRDGVACSAGAILGRSPPSAVQDSSGLDYLRSDLLWPSEGGIFSTYQRPYFVADWGRDRGFFISSANDRGDSGIRRLRLSTMIENAQADRDQMGSFIDDTFTGQGFTIDREGDVYTSSSSGNSRPIIRINGDTLRETGRFGFRSNGLSNGTTRFVTVNYLAVSEAFGSNWLFTGGIFDSVGILQAPAGGGLSYHWGYQQEIAESRVKGVATGTAPGQAWVLGGARFGDSTGVRIYSLAVTGLLLESASFSHIGTVAPTDLDPAATFIFDGNVGMAAVDRSDGSLIFAAETTTDPGWSRSGPSRTWIVKWNPTDGVVWKTEVSGRVLYDAGWSASNIHGDMAFIGGLTLNIIDTSDGSLSTINISSEINEFGAQVWDSDSQSLIAYDTSDGWIRLFVDAADLPQPIPTRVVCRTGQFWVR